MKFELIEKPRTRLGEEYEICILPKGWIKKTNKTISLRNGNYFGEFERTILTERAVMKYLEQSDMAAFCYLFKYQYLDWILTSSMQLLQNIYIYKRCDSQYHPEVKCLNGSKLFKGLLYAEIYANQLKGDVSWEINKRMEKRHE